MSGVPAHDEKDQLFAVEHGLPAVRVIEEEGEGGGVLVHSEEVCSFELYSQKCNKQHNVYRNISTIFVALEVDRNFVICGYTYS